MINIDFLVCVIWLRDKCETGTSGENMKIILNLNLRLTMKKREKSFDGYSLFSLIIWYKYGSGKW